LAEELITDRATWELRFLVHTQLARAGASDGHSEYVYGRCQIVGTSRAFRNRRPYQ
jgi:hypothetical protein